MEVLLGGLWQGNTVTGRLIIVVIALLAALAASTAWRHLVRYSSETQRLATVRARLRTWRAEDRNEARFETAPETGEPEDPEVGSAEGVSREEPKQSSEESSESGAPLVDLELLRDGIEKTSLVFERIAAIQELRSHHVRVNLDTLQHLSLARDQAKPGVATAGFVASTAIMLGIFGTFIGLSAMVQEIHLGLPTGAEELSIDSWTESMGNLRKVLGGMKTAFATSLMGMACGIGALSVDFCLRRRRAAFFEAFDRFTVRELLPAAVPAVDDESLLERVTFRLDESFERLETIHAQNREALRKLTGAQEAFRTIVGEIRSITRSEAANDLEKVIVELKVATESMLGLTKHLPAIATVVRQSTRATLDKIDEVVARQWTAQHQDAPAKILGLPVNVLVVAAIVAVVVSLLGKL